MEGGEERRQIEERSQGEERRHKRGDKTRRIEGRRREEREQEMSCSVYHTTESEFQHFSRRLICHF